MVAEIALPTQAVGHVRRLDMRHDLAKVADLVELCFFDTLDPEGRQYLNEMRRAAQNPTVMGWASNLIDESPMPYSGYVWIEDDRLVGNLSLIPISWQGKRGYMIANVATHPDFRDRGIATTLTMTALRHAEQHGAGSVWLQVRAENASALHIYEVNGFIERLRRTSWYSGPNNPSPAYPPGVRIRPRQVGDWKYQRIWLTQCYPAELTWNIPFDWNSFRPDVWGTVYRMFTVDFLHHWSVERDGELKGVVSWKPSGGFTDSLWLAMPEEVDQDAILALLNRARNDIRKNQPLSLNFPAGLGVEMLNKAGFYAYQTLIWMEYQFSM